MITVYTSKEAFELGYSPALRGEMPKLSYAANKIKDNEIIVEKINDKKETVYTIWKKM